MIVSFRDSATEDIFHGKSSKAARRTCPRMLWRVVARKLEQLDSVVTLDDLRAPPGNRLELLSGDRKGQHCIRVNEQYRICFQWTDAGPDRVEVTDYHQS
uniref:Proteic killer suppression protein n=1 Tax=Candidatus Kentrum sp. LFY TaxID=2126342 RepID=A0A450X6T5_9GAMM|nr:MAG: proteic killer suppression protein [Candidatus Kentron sp. LFY]